LSGARALSVREIVRDARVGDIVSSVHKFSGDLRGKTVRWPTRRPGRIRAWSLRLALTGLLVTGLGPVVAASASSTGSIPNCPPGTSATLQLDCVVPSWVAPAHYGFAIQASLTGPLTRTWIKASPSTGYAHWIYTGRVRIHSPLKICPQPVPLGAIPCQVA